MRQWNRALVWKAVAAVGLTFLAFYCRSHLGPSWHSTTTGARRTTLTGVVEALWLVSVISVLLALRPKK